MLLSRFKSFAVVLVIGSFWNLRLVLGAPEMFGNTDNQIEHQVTSQQAKQAVKDIEPRKMVAAGCKACSRVETAYCRSSDVISDHCCCDRKYRETFPYMEHTCLFEESPCQLIARDCSEYVRIVDCCCHEYLANKWKSNYMKSSSSTLNVIPIMYSFCIYVNFILFKYISRIS